MVKMREEPAPPSPPVEGAQALYTVVIKPMKGIWGKGYMGILKRVDRLGGMIVN